MARRQTVYYYDAENCIYVKRQFSWKRFSLRIGVFAGIALFVGILSFTLFPVLFNDSKTAHLQLESELLQTKMGFLQEKLDHHEQHINELLARDNGIYLPIMGEKEISRSTWLAPKGGSAESRTDDRQVREMWDRIDKLNFRMKMLSASYDDVIEKADEKETEIRNIPSILPANAIMISGFGNRTHPVSGAVKHHDGIDFACQTGTPIYATGNAKVEEANYNDHGYGLVINLDHGNGYRSKYAHLSKILVQEGQDVHRGQLIGYSGSTGLSTGPHLHYEISYNHVKIDPVDFFYEDLSPSRYKSLVSQAEESAAGEEVTIEDIKDYLNTNAPMD